MNEQEIKALAENLGTAMGQTASELAIALVLTIYAVKNQPSIDGEKFDADLRKVIAMQNEGSLVGPLLSAALDKPRAS